MNRRDIIKSTVGIAGAALIADQRQPEAADNRPPTTASRGPFIETRDHEQLFFKDWGSGRPVVFLAAWALPSDMWDYQMVPLSEQGLRCVAYDRRGHGRSSHAGAG